MTFIQITSLLLERKFYGSIHILIHISPPFSYQVCTSTTAHLLPLTDLLWCNLPFTSIGVWLPSSLFELIHSIIEYLYRTLLQLLILKTLWEFIQHNIWCRNCNFVLDRSVGINKYWNKMVCLSECNPSFLIVSLHNSMFLCNTLTLVLIAWLIFMHFHAHYPTLHF